MAHAGRLTRSRNGVKILEKTYHIANWQASKLAWGLMRSAIMPGVYSELHGHGKDNESGVMDGSQGDR
jgi:hypothetical protein